jgi:DtxR family Mn-dependent transcriptional regulator
MKGGLMNDLVDTTEMYLRTIYDLEEEGVVPLRARIAERLEQSGPTVSQTVARMERDGLLRVAGDRHLELTAKGRELATSVMRKHRLAERLLVDIIGLPWEEVHAEACRWEHVMSEDVERRLVQILDNPTVSPFGNPIPGLTALGMEQDPADHQRADHQGADRERGTRGRENLVRLTELPAGDSVAVVVRQLSEHVQGDVALIGRLKEAGVVPDARVLVQTGHDGDVTIMVSGHENVELPHEMAQAVKVEKV